MKTIEVSRLHGGTSRYLVPSIAEAERHAVDTWGSQYDPVEKKRVEGCIAMRWEMTGAR